MALEIERKFLLNNTNWRSEVQHSFSIQQGYLNTHPERTIRIRVKGEQAFLTIKGKTNKFTRKEFEYPLPFEDGKELLYLCEQPLIEKTRHVIRRNDLCWEIDEFQGANTGLVIAEVELKYENQRIELPEWIGEEVSDDERYYNSNLVARPFVEWTND